MMKTTLNLILFLLLSCAVSAQEPYRFAQLDLYDGLSHNQVNAVLRDGKGFVWFGTMSGLNRYDGYDFKVFRNKAGDSNSLHDNYVHALYELPDQKILVRSRDEASVYDAATEKFNRNISSYLQSLKLPPGRIASVLKDSNNSFWFLYDSIGLYRYNTNQTIPVRNASIAAIQQKDADHLWILHRNGFLELINTKNLQSVYTSSLLQTNTDKPLQLFADKEGGVWVWTANELNGLTYFDSKTNTIKRFSESSPGSRLSADLITGMIQDDNGIIWAATDHGGINLINKNNFSIRYLLNDPKDDRSLSQNSIMSITKDDKGVIWIGTFKQGVNVYNERNLSFAHYYHVESNRNSLPYDDVNKFVEDKNGNLWIGTNGGGLIFFNRKENTFKQYLHNPSNKNSISNNVIVSLCIDHNGLLWIGSYFGGLTSFDGKNFNHYRHDPNNPSSLSDDRVWEIFEDSWHRMWVGTLNGGLELFDRSTSSFTHHRYIEGKQSPLQSNYVAALVEDRNGDLWIGTSIGVSVFRKNGKIDYYSVNNGGLSNNNILSIYEDSKGRIWIGTREGLNLFNNGKFIHYTTEQGLPDNSILTIVEDKQGEIWITTPNGLCKFQIKDGNLSITNYDEINNLQGREFNENAALVLRSGELIFGGPYGFNIIDPSKIPAQQQDDQIVFTDLQIQNKTIAPGEKINGRVILERSLPYLSEVELKYKENVFSIEFSSLHFPHNSRERYAYMLEGFNKDWLFTDGSQRRITYTNLDPGHYTFKVKVLGTNGNWSKEKILEITIDPPFWLTPLAFIIYAFTVIALLWLGRKIIIDRARMRFNIQQQKKEAERIQALDQLKTKFFTNVSHEFRTPLSLILSPLDTIIKQEKDPDQVKQLTLVQRNAKRLLNLVNQLLDFRKMEVQEIKLYPAIGDIVQFTKDISLSFNDISEKKSIHLSFESNVDSLEIYFDKDKMEKILFNLLSNAFKYTPDGGSVKVSLRHNEQLYMVVADSGIGIPPDKHEQIFERFFQHEVPQSMVNQGSGIGLAITKEFVKLHGGNIKVDSEPGKGTIFTVELPVQKINPVQESIVSTTNAASNGKKKTILVVEDNEDLRFYLKDNLKSTYHVEEAINGKEGWEKVRELQPDLVVSDVMMPLMDGIELAKHIKADTLTAHIPVILLTAVGNNDKQVEGFAIGVSDYITKPFTFEILAARISNLFAQQKMLQRKFQKQIEVNPSEVTVTPVDEQFLTNALAIVEKNMDNPDFSVEEFSRDMCMSRVALYKKILSLTGRPPLEFIRSIRLKRAAQLLEKSGKSVSEIAYEVGFNNPKVFTKYFKEEFKILPSQYKVNN